MNDCLFCKIIAGDIPAKKVYEDEQTLAFYDIDPQAPTHILVIPKKHYEGVHNVPAQEKELFATLMLAVGEIVLQEKLTETGYRLVINSGTDALQAVPHIHVHILSGRSMQWPPG